MSNAKTNRAPTSPRSARAPGGQEARPPESEEILLDGSDREHVWSLNYRKEMSIEITGATYDTRMPRISRSASGKVTVMPVIDVESGETGLLIVPALLSSWLDRQDNYMGMRLHLSNKGIDPETGIRKIGVRRL